MLIPNKHERLLAKFKDDVSRNPSADFAPSIRALAAEFRKLEKEREKRLVDALFLNLYGMDAKSLRRDLGKLAVLGTAQPAPSQRIALLRCLFGVLALYGQEHFPETYAMVEAASREEDCRSAPDAWGSLEPPE